MNNSINCHLCEIELGRVVIGLNKKLLGNNIIRFYCLDCLASYLGVTLDELLVKIEEFRAKGCKAFLES